MIKYTIIYKAINEVDLLRDITLKNHCYVFINQYSLLVSILLSEFNISVILLHMNVYKAIMKLLITSTLLMQELLPLTKEYLLKHS